MLRLSIWAKPTSLHHFLDGFARNGYLLQRYTKNIDCTEHRLPSLWEMTAQVHSRMGEAICQYYG